MRDFGLSESERLKRLSVERPEIASTADTIGVSKVAATAQEPEFVRLSVVARRLDVAPSTLVASIGRGELRAVRLGTRGHWRVSRESVNRLVGEEPR